MLPLLDIQDLSVDFVSENETAHAVRNISFSVNRSEILAIVGESGSGKTVTALSILQLLPCPPAKYASGKIIFSTDGLHGENLLAKDSAALRRFRGHRIGMIFQEPMSSLNPVLTCGHQVTEAILAHLDLSTKAAKELTIWWFEKVKLPDAKNIYSRYPHEISGGQKQRVMIAMAMCCELALLICDEPTTALDVTVQKNILSLIRELQQEQNIGVIFITHDLGVVSEIADRAIVMYRGEIAEQGTVPDIFAKPQHSYTRGLLACRPVLHPKGERLPVVADFMQATINPPVKRSSAPAVVPGTKKLLLQVTNLTVQFPLKKNFLGKAKSFINAVDDVSFEVYEGETLGLVGESGCGKTTLGRCLLRLIKPTHGMIQYNGVDIGEIAQKEMRNLRKDLQIVFQDPYSSLNPRITIGSAIGEPMTVHHKVSGKEKKRRVIGLLEKVDLRPEHFNRYPHEFSGGQRQRIVIARALSVNPSFIVCDESVSALDVSVQAQVLNLLNDLKKEFGFTIVFISHDLSVVRYISDRIMVMNRGKIVETGSSDEIYFHPQQEYTKRLIAAIPGSKG